MMQKNKRFLVLQIDTRIKTAFIEKSKGSIIVKDIGSFAKNKKGIGAGRKNIIVLIPPKKVMIRYLELPSRSISELRDMINFQLPRYLPHSLDDIIFDFRIVQGKEEGYSKVMVACIQNELFKEILEIIPNLENNLQGIFLCGETGADFLQSFQKDKRDVQALVDISSEETTLSILDSNGVLFMRSLNAGFFTDEKNWHKGFEELEKTFIAFGREFSGKKVEAIVISGAKAYASNFYNFLKGESSRDIELFNPFKHVRSQKNIMEKFDNLSFHSVIGAAVDIEKRHINLVSKESLVKKEKRLKKRGRVQALLLTMVILFQLCFILYKEIDKKKAYLNHLGAEIRKTESKAKAIEDKEKRTSLIKVQLEAEGSALDILREVYRIVPPNISINILIFEKDNSLSIRGTSRTMAEVFNLIPQLEKSPYFVKVISEGTKMRKLKNRVVADFQIRALLKKNGK